MINMKQEKDSFSKNVMHNLNLDILPSTLILRYRRYPLRVSSEGAKATLRFLCPCRTI